MHSLNNQQNRTKMKTAIILISKSGFTVAEIINHEIADSTIYSTAEIDNCCKINNIAEFVSSEFHHFDAFVFIGAMGICVRSIAPCLEDKHTDPAVINVDSTGQSVVSVLSGHVGGANELTQHIANILGAKAVVTTQSDNAGKWALDTLGSKYNWATTQKGDTMNHLIATFVNEDPVALLLQIKDAGTQYMERTCPPNVHIFYHLDDIVQADYKMLIAVTPCMLNVNIPLLHYHPRVLHLGVGCRKNCLPDGIETYILQELKRQELSSLSIASIATIELKKDEALLKALQQTFSASTLHIYNAEELKEIEVPHPSEKVFEVTGVYGVAESTALKSADNGPLLIEKHKGLLTQGNDFTFALAMDRKVVRSGHIEIVGAGPGDPELVSVRGRRMLQEADLILYAGSLVPRELTLCAKEGATVRSSASMTLEEQFAIMKTFYDKGLFVVRLHTGDPCIYGAIQEQMAFFDKYGMSYHITPGISSFQAAAAALQSQFTIPEKVQTIILTRGEGRTPMPEKEKLHLLARSQSTMCIYLSAGVVDQVEKELLEHYPPTTPVAACYRLTWKEERIYRGELKDLARIVKENNLTLTTMIVVGDAIGNRKGLSHLYSSKFTHLFRRSEEDKKEKTSKSEE